MLERILREILAEYPGSRNQLPYTEELGNKITKTAPELVSEALGDFQHYFLCEGSWGKGNRAAIPWLAIFYPPITVSAQEGYYVVFLFDPDARKVYLSLNQGVTRVKKEFGEKEAILLLKSRASRMRKKIKELISNDNVLEISILTKSSSGFHTTYSAGHVYGHAYNLDDFPDNDTLVEHLQAMCDAYLVLEFRGGINPKGYIGDLEDNAEERPIAAKSIIERKQYRIHRSIERNQQAANLAKKSKKKRCDACGFDFNKAYGKELAKGYIEAHHLKPLSSLRENEMLSYDVVKDFALLCANCHRMIHRMPDPSDIEGLRRIIQQQAKEQ